MNDNVDKRDLDKLAAELRNLKPSKPARARGMDAAMAAFDAEFESASEKISDSPQGLAEDPRPTGQTVRNGRALTFGGSVMDKLTKIFEYTPKKAMMGGSALAAIMAAMIFIPAINIDTGPDVSPVPMPPPIVEVTEPEVSPAPSTDVEVIAPATPETPAAETSAPETPEPAMLEPETPDVKASVETSVPTAPAPIETTPAPAPVVTEVSDVAPDLPPNTIVVERRVMKTPARTMERIIPNVTKTETRRIVKSPGIPTGRMVPAVTKEVTRRVIKTPAATQERIIPAVTRQITHDFPQADGSVKTLTATVVVQEASTALVTVPPTYQTVTETVVVVPAGPEYEPGTATYETIAEAVVVQEASTELVTVPAVYETVRETLQLQADGSVRVIGSEAVSPEVSIMAEAKIAPLSGFTSGRADEYASETTAVSAPTSAPVSAPMPAPPPPPGYASSGESVVTGGSSSPYVALDEVIVTGGTSSGRLERSSPRASSGSFSRAEAEVKTPSRSFMDAAIPATTKTISHRVLKTPARTVERTIPAITKMETRRIENPDGSFDTVMEPVVVQEASTELVTIPATYETVTEIVRVDADGNILPDAPIEPPRPRPQSGQLTAGDYDDVLNPDLYKIYLDKMLQGPLKGKDLPYVDANKRINIRVLDTLGQPVPLADIRLTSPQGNRMFPLRTGADGMAYLYPGFDNLKSGTTVRVSAKGGRAVKKKLSQKLVRSGGDFVIDLRLDAAPAQKLDLLLTMDATGSMGDEMRYLQSEIKAIVGRVEVAHPGVDIRTGLIVYRDKGDDYVVREVPFTDDIEAFRVSLAAQTADGGGDFPEAMHSAMEAGLKMDWRDDAVKVNLLVADAPPHDRNIDDTWDAGLLSRTEGIHIVPLAASGVDKSAEFLMRAMAQITGGRFLFLTDDSGIGNAHAEPTVDCYVVTRLDGLVTRVLSSLMTGERVEPEAGDVIRSVGNYRAGTCAVDAPGQTVLPENVTYKLE